MSTLRRSAHLSVGTSLSYVTQRTRHGRQRDHQPLGETSPQLPDGLRRAHQAGSSGCATCLDQT